MKRYFERNCTESFVETQHAFSFAYRAHAIKKAFITSVYGHNTNAIVCVINNGSCALYD